MNYNAYSEQMVLDGVQKYGPAPGARKMMDWEFNHAKEAIESGYYITYYCEKKKSECSRVGSGSMCFCRHLMKDHKQNAFTKKRDTTCTKCACKCYAFIPQRPEEIGEWWLPRRKEFDINKWRAKCKCKHGHDQHRVTRPFICNACGNCFDFKSDFECISCDCLWEEHETLYETREERVFLKKPVDEAYLPLSDKQEIQNLVFFNKPQNIINKTRPAQIKHTVGPPKLKQEPSKIIKKEPIRPQMKFQANSYKEKEEPEEEEEEVKSNNIQVQGKQFTYMKPSTNMNNNINFNSHNNNNINRFQKGYK